MKKKRPFVVAVVTLSSTLSSRYLQHSFTVSALNILHHDQSRRSTIQTIAITTDSLLFLGGSALVSPVAAFASASAPSTSTRLRVVRDPRTYSALYYGVSPKVHAAENPSTSVSDQTSTAAAAAAPVQPRPPLILVLHGAGRNDLDIVEDLANPLGEHAGLIPSLIAAGTAPATLLENFAVLAPYAYGKKSFYEDAREKLLNFVDWAEHEPDIQFDRTKIFLLGFSDGATVAVELMTTGRFAGAVICSYGYSGQHLPAAALQRLAGRPMWVFHSADDVVFDVNNSDRLVEQLRLAEKADFKKTNSSSSIVRYSRFDRDPENLPARVRGHSTGITASKMSEIYQWMLLLSPI